MKKINTPTTILPEHLGNPFIASLPPLMSNQDAIAKLSEDPIFSVRERKYPHHLRRACVLRLNRHFFRPMRRHLELETLLAHLIRDGYDGRNISDGSYLKHLQNNHARVVQRNLLAQANSASSTAAGLTLIGCSGMGKTETARRILKLYPQVIEHVNPFSFQQVVWLKLECPHAGSARQLCLEFFQAMDALIGTNYFRQYHRSNLDVLATQMGSVATRHGLGLLVIDELQNLLTKDSPNRRYRGQSDKERAKLLNFLLTLINKIGVPMLLVGTLAASPLLIDSLRVARRASSLGSRIWDRLDRTEGWDYFINQLWKFQWTTKQTKINDEIINTFYEETQGILDLAVKLFILAQMTVITNSESNHDAPRSEELTPKLLKHVAKENFKLLGSMLTALKKGDREAIAQYDDIRPFHEHIQEIFMTSVPSSAHRDAPYAPPSTPRTPAESTDARQRVRNSLAELEIGEDIIETLLSTACAQVQTDDPAMLMSAILSQMQPTKSIPTPKFPLSKKPATTKRKPKPVLQDGDVRQIVKDGKGKKITAHEALASAGMISPAEKLFRAS